MSDLRIIVDHMQFEYSGLFDLNNLFKTVDAWLFERNYEKRTNKNFEENTPTGKFIEWEIASWHKATDYVRNIIKVRMLMYDLKKVEATRDLCVSINSAIQIEVINRKFRSIDFTGGVLFCCVDKIDTRKTIFETVKERADLFIDGRMSAEYVRIFTVHDEASREHYATTLFPAAEAYQGACTAKTTIYCANVSAGLRVAQFAKWLRGCDVDKEIDVNLLTNEMGAK